MRIKITIVAAAMLLAACSDGNVFSLEVGDCFDDVSSTADEVSSVPIVDCAEPHDNEIFAVYDIEGTEFPGQTEVQESADEECLRRFADWAGIAYSESALITFPITPTADSWDAIDDRAVACVIYDAGLKKLTGSMAGAGY